MRSCNNIHLFSVLVNFFSFNINSVIPECITKDIYDYIVVGSGSSGAVVATRLSEDPTTSILLLEAGEEPLKVTELPYFTLSPIGSKMDWNYKSERQKSCCKAFGDRIVPMSRAKALGGTSTMNGLVVSRGNKKDYDRWAELGNTGWDYESVLPYFKKLEDYKIPRTREDDPYHNEGGPMSVMHSVFKTSLSDAFLQAGKELNLPLVDYNAKNQIGVMLPTIAIKNCSRCTTYTGYLKPAMNRSNLHVVTNALVSKILIDEEKTATGVQYERKKSQCSVKASKEIIISAGVFNSPQLLMLSGIGPKDVLDKFKIPVIAELPGVGQNLQDHVALRDLVFAVNKPVTVMKNVFQCERDYDKFEKSRKTLTSCPETLDGMAYYASKYANSSDWPDIDMHFISINLKGCMPSIIRHFIRAKEKNVIVYFMPHFLHQKSRGYVTLRSNKIHDPPIIDPQYLSHPDDMKVMVETLKLMWEFVNTKSLQYYGLKLLLGSALNAVCKPHEFNSYEYNKCVVENLSTTTYHNVGTCKMGPQTDPMAVIDNRLRVHSVKKLRVADASVFPFIVSANTATACMMIGEKVSDMIKEDNKQQ